MTMIVWPWWGGQMYRIVTGVTYAVCLLSTYVVYDKSEQSGELPDSVNIPSFLCYGIYGIANISSGVSIEIWHCVMSKCNVWNVQAKTDPIIFLLNTKVVCLWLRHVVLNRHLAAVITKIFFGGEGGHCFFSLEMMTLTTYNVTSSQWVRLRFGGFFCFVDKFILLE